MPRTAAAPPRLLEATQILYDPDRADVPGAAIVECETPCILDLDQIIGLRTPVRWRDHVPTPLSDRVVVERRNEGELTVLLPVETLGAAWLAYRTHADALGRLRN